MADNDANMYEDPLIEAGDPNHPNYRDPSSTSRAEPTPRQPLALRSGDMSSLAPYGPDRHPWSTGQSVERDVGAMSFGPNIDAKQHHHHTQRSVLNQQARQVAQSKHYYSRSEA